MNFWENVDSELKYLGMTRKELATAAGFNVSNIANGIRDGNVPSAETALKIATHLGVTVKYLLTGTKEDSENSQENDAFEKYKKYRAVIDSLDTMPEKMRFPIINMILSLGK